MGGGIKRIEHAANNSLMAIFLSNPPLEMAVI